VGVIELDISSQYPSPYDILGQRSASSDDGKMTSTAKIPQDSKRGEESCRFHDAVHQGELEDGAGSGIYHILMTRRCVAAQHDDNISYAAGSKITMKVNTLKLRKSGRSPTARGRLHRCTDVHDMYSMTTCPYFPIEL